MAIAERTTTWGAAVVFLRGIELLLATLAPVISRLQASGPTARSTVQGFVEDFTGSAIAVAQITLNR